MKKQAPCSSSSYVQTLVLVFASIHLISHQNCLAKHHQPCPTSSCGKVTNITYPFRLKTDPKHCGDKRYELDCNENGPLVTISSGENSFEQFSRKYYVQHIDYKIFTISLSDAGAVEDANCSFIPRYFLYKQSLSHSYFNKADFVFEPYFLRPEDQRQIAYFNCSNPIKDPRYVKVDMSRCSRHGNSSTNHVYAVLQPSVYSLGDIEVGCDFMVATLAKAQSEIVKENVSYDEIHGIIIHGFELSWLPMICEDRCGKGTSCEVVDEGSGEVKCDKRFCHYVYQTTDKCGTYNCLSLLIC